MSVGESKKLAELNNLIWSPQEDWNEQDILDGIRQNVSGISDRARRTWSRSPLNVAVCKMRFESVRMLVGEAGLEVNSVDEINHCERSPLTSAISRGRSQVEDSLKMLHLLIDDLGADVNQVLAWKFQEQQEPTKKLIEQRKEFTPLMLAVMTNQPRIVQLLLDKGADDRFRGCCLAAKTWMCGSALGLAKMLHSHPDIIQMLEHQIQKRMQMEHLDNDILAYQDLLEPDRIKELKLNPNYMRPEDIEREKRELEDRARALEARIQFSRDIEAEIRFKFHKTIC